MKTLFRMKNRTLAEKHFAIYCYEEHYIMTRRLS